MAAFSFPFSMPTLAMEQSTPNRQNETLNPGEKPRRKNRGNFANDPNRAREAGRKGGKARGRRRLA